MSFEISIWTQMDTDYEDLLHELYNQILAIVFLCCYKLYIKVDEEACRNYCGIQSRTRLCYLLPLLLMPSIPLRFLQNKFADSDALF